MAEFYRRKLPESCVDFSSAEGKQLFCSAVNNDRANIYFKLAAQFRTQEEPAFCGPSTLVMVLNALEVDPGKVWKGPWRWYHEEMLECCLPLEKVKKFGISFRHFSCLASCNRLRVNPTRAHDTSDEAVETFREAVVRSVSSEDTVLVINYNRGTLGQTGTGHFSPIAAYDPLTDKALIMDVARFKYPPHWVPVPLIYKAMSVVTDARSNAPRGYMQLTLAPETRPLLMFKLSQSFIEGQETFWNCITQWMEWLKTQSGEDLKEDEILSEGIKMVQELFPSEICCQRTINVTPSDSCAGDSCCCASEKLEACGQALCCEIGNLPTTKFIKNEKVSSAVGVAVLILSWPYGSDGKGGVLKGIAERVSTTLSKDTKNELDQLRNQISVLISNRDILFHPEVQLDS